MTLEFRPPFQINPNAEGQQERSLLNLNRTISGIGDDALRQRQYRLEKQRQEQLMRIQEEQAARKRESFGPIDPSAWGGSSQPGPMGASPSGGTTSGTWGPMPTSSPQPNYSMETGQDAYASPSGGAPMPVDHTSHFMSWKNSGMPSTYDHPDYGGQARPNPMASFDQNMFYRLNKPQREAYLSGIKESREGAYRESEIDKNRAMAEMYRKGGPNSNKGTWHQNPFTGEYEFYPNVMPNGGGTPSAASRQAAPSGVASKIPFKDRAKLEAEAREISSVSDSAIAEINSALELNKNTYGGKAGEYAFKAKSALNLGQNDPKFKNTASVTNTLKAQVSKVLKSTFGGQLSDSERAYLNEVYGAADGMSQTEREIAMQNVIKMLQQKRSASRAKAGIQEESSGRGLSKTYKFTASGPNGERIGSDDGENWTSL